MSSTTPAFSWRDLTHQVRRNLLLIAVASLVGAVVGVLVAVADPTYRATALVGVRSGAEVSTSTATETAAVSIVSPAVIEKAARELGEDPGTLGSQVSATVRSGTSLIELTAADTDADAALRNVTKVADVAIQDYSDRSAAVAQDVRNAGEEQLTSGTLSDDTAEKARTASIGSTVGVAQGQSITGAVTISIVSPALNAYLGGMTRSVGAILGAALGALLSTLLALSTVWRRWRKVRSAADLEDVPGARAVLRGDDLAGLTGTALTSGERYLVVGGASETNRRAICTELARGLRQNGYSASQISVLEGAANRQPLTRGEADRWSVGSAGATSVLARAERLSVRGIVHTDFVLVDIAEIGSASAFLAGQADFLPILLVPSGTRFAHAPSSCAAPAGSS